MPAARRTLAIVWLIAIVVAASRVGNRPKDVSLEQLLLENSLFLVVVLAGVVSAVSKRTVTGPHPFRRAVAVAVSIIVVCVAIAISDDGSSSYLPADQAILDWALLFVLVPLGVVASLVWLVRYRWRDEIRAELARKTRVAALPRARVRAS